MAKQVPDRNWMESLRKELGFKDPGIFEKSVYAFNLLGEVVKVYPRLVFKGGTSLLLHIFPPARLSIDIDILLPADKQANLTEKLSRMAEDSDWFDTLEEDPRSGKKIPKAHYKFRFNSHFSRLPQYVLLDVVFTEPPYGKLVEKDIAKNPMAFAGVGGVVRVPSVEGLFGDKLTAISPKTIGIPLAQGRTMEFIKQVIDLGELFLAIEDAEELKNSFVNTTRIENGFRNRGYTFNEVLDDAVEIAFRYSQYMLRGGSSEFPEIELLNNGIRKIVNHLKDKFKPEDYDSDSSNQAKIPRIAINTGPAGPVYSFPQPQA